MTSEEIKERLELLADTFDYQQIGDSHEVIKEIRGIQNNSKPNPKKQFIAEGFWLTSKVIKYNVKVNKFIMCIEDIKTNEGFEVAQSMSEIADRKYLVSKKVFEKISERDKQDGLLAIAELPKYDINDFHVRPDAKSVILVLDGVEIPGNIGTMVRVADGAGVTAMFICNRKARLTHPKYINSSMGSAFYIPTYEFESVDDCYDWLKKHNFEVFLADTRADHSYFEEDFGRNTALVLGSERYGISRTWYDKEITMISIPMLGDCDSLNVGVAGTILMYEASMKNKLFMKR